MFKHQTSLCRVWCNPPDVISEIMLPGDLHNTFARTVCVSVYVFCRLSMHLTLARHCFDELYLKNLTLLGLFQKRVGVMHGASGCHYRSVALSCVSLTEPGAVASFDCMIRTITSNSKGLCRRYRFDMQACNACAALKRRSSN